MMSHGDHMTFHQTTYLEKVHKVFCNIAKKDDITVTIFGTDVRVGHAH